MKADPSAQKQLLALQEIDTQLAQAAHKKSTLPEHAQLAEVQTQGRQLSEELVAVETRLSDAARAADRAEADLVPVRERREKNQQRVDAGQGDPKALQAMIDEIAHLGRRIGDLEDVQLEAMEQLEQITRTRDEIRSKLVELKQQFNDLKITRDQLVQQIDRNLSQLAVRREQVLPLIPADLLALYQKIVARSGSGAASLVGRRCTGCGLEANSADYARYSKTSIDEVLRCEECGRILVRVS